MSMLRMSPDGMRNQFDHYGVSVELHDRYLSVALDVYD